MEAYTYMLYCKDGSFYTGWTNNLQKRLAAHNEGKGAKYTRVRLPVKLVYYERYSSKSAAMHREYEIKQLTHGEKMSLCSDLNDKLF
ncbi:GIY-YIG nuclease family protein [Pectinatus cerevisiiphilus]|uniref:Putative endonuclease n=1 Tax=Pectinatus cerevisiiphilus TaxID=86956 RepID=A0A4R3KD63_9FIRM|nr:GIY-YIG nuclease family protein [Pectinatus cerevisiiphilus]TCS80879.1 putative endonuclease [Pectinatus cerevisiiphilus]